MKIKSLSKIILFFTILISFVSCGTSNLVLSHGTDLSKYHYVVFGDETTGDRELDDVIMMAENTIAETRLTVVTPTEGLRLLSNGEYILSPNIHVTSEKHDGGYTYITITFYDYKTSSRLAVVKSSGIGLTVSDDQRIALDHLAKQLKTVFR